MLGNFKMRNIKIIIEFDGTDYCGWQIQPNALSVQEKIEKALEKLTKEKSKINSSGRTDRGVHALNMVANFLTNSKIPAEKFALALNSVLPKDIVIKDSREVDGGFHARYSAKGKKYRYVILNSKHPSALYRNRSCHIKAELNHFKMIEAAKYFIGTHNFRAFSATGTNVKNFTREIYQLDIIKNDEFIYIEIAGNGFLYNMVRIIAGTLIDVGREKIEPSQIKYIIASKDRKKASKTVPPQGLYLCEVYY